MADLQTPRQAPEKTRTTEGTGAPSEEMTGEMMTGEGASRAAEDTTDQTRWTPGNRATLTSEDEEERKRDAAPTTGARTTSVPDRGQTAEN